MSIGEVSIVAIAGLLGFGVGGCLQCWLGFRPSGWQASNGKRYRNVEIGDDHHG